MTWAHRYVSRHQAAANLPVKFLSELWSQGALNDYANPKAELRYVGKRGQKESIKQPDIDSLLVSLCQQVGPCPSCRHSKKLTALLAQTQFTWPHCKQGNAARTHMTLYAAKAVMHPCLCVYIQSRGRM